MAQAGCDFLVILARPTNLYFEMQSTRSISFEWHTRRPSSKSAPRNYTGLLAPILLVALSGCALEPAKTFQLSIYESKQHTLTATVGGKIRTFLFDTGEGTTMLSPEVALDLGCRPQGNEVAFRMLGERFEAPRCDEVRFSIDGYEPVARSVLIYDIANLTGPNSPKLDGAVGLDLFDKRTITLDYANSALILETESSAKERTKGLAPLPIRLTRYANGGIDLFIGIRTEEGFAWMTLDSANAGPTIFIAPKFAALFGLDLEAKESQAVTLPLNSEIKMETRARVFQNMIMDGNVGMQLLKNHAVTIDLSRELAWIRKEATK